MEEDSRNLSYKRGRHPFVCGGEGMPSFLLCTLRVSLCLILSDDFLSDALGFYVWQCVSNRTHAGLLCHPLILPSLTHTVEVCKADIENILPNPAYIDPVFNQILPDSGVGDVSLEQDSFHLSVF